MKKQLMLFVFCLGSVIALSGNSSDDTITVVTTSDSRLEVFYIDNGTLYHNYQISPNGSWSGDHFFAGPVAAVTAGKLKDGRAIVFFADTSYQLYFRLEEACGYGPSTQFYGWGKKLSLATNQDGRLSLLYLGTDDRIWESYQSYPEQIPPPGGSWNSYAVTNGPKRDLATILGDDGRITLFFTDGNKTLFRMEQTAPNHGWGSQVQMTTNADDLVVAKNQNGGIQIIYTTQSGPSTDALFHMVQGTVGGAYAPPAWLDAARSLEASIAMNQNGTLVIGYVGTNNSLYGLQQSAPNSPQFNGTSGGDPASGIAMGRQLDGRVALLYTDPSGSLWLALQTVPGAGFGNPIQL